MSNTNWAYKVDGHQILHDDFGADQRVKGVGAGARGGRGRAGTVE
jgi:hypothetical protein